MRKFTESAVEQAALEWLEAAGWATVYGESIAPGEPAAERTEFTQTTLDARLFSTLTRLNPDLPASAIEDALKRLLRAEGPDLVTRNRATHRHLVNGVTVEYRAPDGQIRGAQVRVIDFDHPENNDFLAVNQFTVVEGKVNRRPDVVLFVNGLPLVVFELKNAVSGTADVWEAYAQLQTYKEQIPTLFHANALLVISDGVSARVGSLTAGKEWFKAWHADAADRLEVGGASELQTVIEDLCAPPRLLDLIRDFIVFEDDGAGAPIKKIAGYHQYHAVQRAVGQTLRAATAPHHSEGNETDAGDQRVGVVWHTQGSGKSLTMAFYAGRIIREPLMGNPTLVVLTDRNDLDQQLFATFSRCHELLRQQPVQADSRAQMRELLTRESGGVIFTTLQKFFPEEKGGRLEALSGRRNMVVIADEAHRSQYDLIDGYARHLRDALPNASFIGFTGTPIEQADANTRAIFGDYIDVYDIQKAVEDGATVPIYYEQRLAKLHLDDDQRLSIDPEFDAATETEEAEGREKLKSKWAQLAAVVGAPERVKAVAADIVEHFESRLTNAMDGKGMIVTMSRPIAVALYDEIVALRPAWQGEGEDDGFVNVIMTGSASDGPEWQRHIRSKSRRGEMATKFRDPDDPFKLVIVRDMWLTGFDAPSLHTMYVDKPMRGHGLMQAIARVNRVFRDKPGGLVVDYIGIAAELKEALHTYRAEGGKGAPSLDIAEAIAEMLRRYETVGDFFLNQTTSRGVEPGFDYGPFLTGKPSERLACIGNGLNYILGLPDGKQRYMDEFREFKKAYALAAATPEAEKIREEIAFFEAVNVQLGKRSLVEHRRDDAEMAIRQIVSRSVLSEGVVDIFQAAGLSRPAISLLSEEFLAEMQHMPQRNLAVEMLERLLLDEIKVRGRRNVVLERRFSQLLEATVIKYRNRAIDSAMVIQELVDLARELREAGERGEKLGLNEDEFAFYEALDANGDVAGVMGDAQLAVIARELVDKVRANAAIDWTLRESVRAQMRVMVKRILKKYGYPPDLAEGAVATVLEQAEALSGSWGT
ncbi:type I restriction endonuclease subunit R [Demequina sp.]|uniref:type I restriction endonuclease subunit R n=1 Tax=Demequina sp. TaxID=2050685 RepID=UPI0025B9FF0C|nr:type I restriction endonuclease subunit R [Demequina sp.]